MGEDVGQRRDLAGQSGGNWRARRRERSGAKGKRRRGLEEPRARATAGNRSAEAGTEGPGRPFHVGSRAGPKRGGSMAGQGCGRGRTGRGGAAHWDWGRRSEGGGRAGQGVPEPAAPQARGSMPGTAAPEVAGAGHSGAGGHGVPGSPGPFDPEVERPRRRPGIGRGPAGTKKPGALGGDASAGPRSKR